MEDLIYFGRIGLIIGYRELSSEQGHKAGYFCCSLYLKRNPVLLRSLKKTRKDVSLHDLIGTEKEGNEITLIDIIGSEADDH